MTEAQRQMHQRINARVGSIDVERKPAGRMVRISDVLGDGVSVYIPFGFEPAVEMRGNVAHIVCRKITRH